METPPIDNHHLSPEYIEALKKYTKRTENLNPVDLVHGAYYWVRFLPNGEFGELSGNLYIGQYTKEYHQFDLCGDESGWDDTNFEVLEMIEYKGNK